MHATIFTELRFWLLIVFSAVVPTWIYVALLRKRAISRATVLLFGFVLVLISGLDVYLLQSLANAAGSSPSLQDDKIFRSEVSLALYLFPVMFGGIGINIMSHILVSHLLDAEARFKRGSPEE
ncbi:hypothetical protein LYSHEL_10930 [Lysobacter helvus]|uniref:Uncharacterized protein n=2 Tax=Lysobacteraceae TaxID=32033 RepID=A0ABM7Q474_9GAMM|nr:MULTISPECIES: hypothetical protein [Lysobacter]BCT92069.1 hypothetical protein LYSCAS_10930 [Lysobacter caseinilyticus]BCT95222.1 hypothetical protein LYSHEL_10930 [Lysobacter helvus]